MMQLAVCHAKVEGRKVARKGSPVMPACGQEGNAAPTLTCCTTTYPWTVIAVSINVLLTACWSDAAIRS